MCLSSWLNELEWAEVCGTDFKLIWAYELKDSASHFLWHTSVTSVSHTSHPSNQAAVWSRCCLTVHSFKVWVRKVTDSCVTSWANDDQHTGSLEVCTVCESYLYWTVLSVLDGQSASLRDCESVTPLSSCMYMYGLIDWMNEYPWLHQSYVRIIIICAYAYMHVCMDTCKYVDWGEQVSNPANQQTN